MEINPIVLSIPVYFILILIELIIDRFKGKKLYRLNDATANIGCGIVEQISGLFAKVFTVAAFYFVWEHFRITDIPNNAFTIFVLWLGVDFCYYWAHRHSHTINLFWIGHSVHHQSEDYNLSVALRQGALQKVFTFWYYFPLAIAGFDPAMFLLVGAFNTLYQFWIHTELIKNMGWFEYVFNTPSHHRVHHARNPKYIDKNHAGSLIIWDKMFGTFAKEEEHPTYGVTREIKTFDPVSAHIKPIAQLIEDVRQTQGFANKLKLLFMPPGWHPAEQGGYQAPKEIDAKHFQKFEVNVPAELNTYLLFQYLITLGGTAFFLFQANNFDLFTRALLASAVVFSVMSSGLLFNGKTWAFKLEGARLIALAGMVIYLSGFEAGVAAAVASLAIISLLWLLRLLLKFPLQTSRVKQVR